MKKKITIEQARSMGGKARALKLSPSRRKEIASLAAKAMWIKKRSAPNSQVTAAKRSV